MATRTRTRTQNQQIQENSPAPFSVMAPDSRRLVQANYNPLSVPVGTPTEPPSAPGPSRGAHLLPRQVPFPMGGQQLGAIPNIRGFDTPSRPQRITEEQ